jgi:RIO kinase 1
MHTNQIFSEDDSYDEMEARFDPFQTDREARRKRSPKPTYRPKVDPASVLKELAEEIGWENRFRTTYRPSKYEADWLFDSLRPFFEGGLILDVVALVKGGKEASVYCCAAHPSLEVDWLAAKVYRPRIFRGLTNDKVYREGRDLLSAEGEIIHENKDRIIRAIGKKTAFGQQVAHSSWLMHEYRALDRLYQAGGSVPKPYHVADNAILMAFIGEGIAAAPTLNSIRLETDEAEGLLDRVLQNVELMLEHNLIHADLSAYNLLYLNGEITLIDLPQVVDPKRNSSAPAILARDIQRVSEYFIAQGLDVDPKAIFRDLWRRHLRVPEHILRADESRLASLYPEIFGSD